MAVVAVARGGLAWGWLKEVGFPAVTGRLRPYGCERVPFRDCQSDSFFVKCPPVNRVRSIGFPSLIHRYSIANPLAFGNKLFGCLVWGWRSVAGGLWLEARGQGLGWLVVWGWAVIGHWRFSWLTGWLSREAWFGVRGLYQMVNGSLFRSW